MIILAMVLTFASGAMFGVGLMSVLVIEKITHEEEEKPNV